MTDDMMEGAANLVANVVRDGASQGVQGAELSALAVDAATACVAGFGVLLNSGGQPAATPCRASTACRAAHSEATL